MHWRIESENDYFEKILTVFLHGFAVFKSESSLSIDIN